MRILAPLLLLALLGPRPAWTQDPRVELEVGFSGRFRPGVWTPIRIEVACGAGGYAGDLDVLVDDHLALRFDVRVAANGGTVLEGLVVLPQAGSTVKVAGTAAAGLRALPEPTPFVVVQDSLSRAAEARVAGDPAPEFARADPLRLPRREGAWDAVDALVLDSRMRAEIERDAGARQALEEWRARGGTCIDADAPGEATAWVAADPRRFIEQGESAETLFPAEPWSGGRRARLLAFLAWVALGASAAIFLAALRPDAAGRACALAAVAGLLLTLAWTQALSPGAMPPARACGRCVVAADGATREEAWVCVGGETRATWGHARTPERPFAPVGRRGPGGHRLGARETWLAPAEGLILHRVRALRAAPSRPALTDAFLAGTDGFRWVGRVEPDGVPATAAEAMPLARLVERYVTADPRAADLETARLERLLAGIDCAVPRLVGRAEAATAFLPPAADPVEGPGVTWIVPARR